MDEILSGTILVPADTTTVVLSAAVLGDIAASLTPAGAQMLNGVLVIESSVVLVGVVVAALSDVTFAVSDLGESIMFTMKIPGFESLAMTVTVQTQLAIWGLWAQVALLVIAAVLVLVLVGTIISRRRPPGGARAHSASGSYLDVGRGPGSLGLAPV
jgi:hypothetical protein